jgi:solute carrier family 35 protein E3
MNPVGFYQLLKIGITPTVVLIQWIGFSKRPSRKSLIAVSVLLVGVTLATVTDNQVSSDTSGGECHGGNILGNTNPWWSLYL